MMDMKTKEYFLITGMARSGTTLLDKLLGSHPSLGVLSQPFPYLYRYLKKIFFEKISHPEKYYVLNNLFQEKLYTSTDFHNFLRTFNLDRKVLIELFNEMSGWSGQLTKVSDIPNLLNEFKPDNFGKTFKFLLEELNYNSGADTLGTKEIMVEEYISYLVSVGIKVIIIIRDPRDVYTSINCGTGTEYVGNYRPSLFHLRNWRKSVAIANTFKAHNKVFILKYEDLLTHQDITLRKIADFLCIKAFPKDHFEGGIPTQAGDSWTGNSSTNKFKGIEKNNSDKYLNFLDLSTIQYIEYICGPEMNSFNYNKYTNVDLGNNYNPLEFKEPFQINIGNLPIKMSTEPDFLKEEMERRRILENGSSNINDIISNFYSVQNYKCLAKYYQK